LVKREGATNHWHSLMEIYSMTLSMDVLQITPQSTDFTPFYIADRDVPNTQVVILDDHPGGPYFDMWSLLKRSQFSVSTIWWPTKILKISLCRLLVQEIRYGRVTGRLTLAKSEKLSIHLSIGR
jgi:hypothetical protein